MALSFEMCTSTVLVLVLYSYRHTFSSSSSLETGLFAWDNKYRTNSTAANYASFGTNEKLWEYEWDFSSNEDFCWVYNDTNKVFSITKDGPACSQLYLADFQPNGNNGRVLTNTIDVKDRLVKYQSAFETMRQGVSNSTDFDTLKANLLTALASV